MKKYLVLSFFLSVTTWSYSQSQRLIVKTDLDSAEFRYWASDGKQLSFYSLAPSLTVNREKAETISLPDQETVYKVLAVGKKSFKVYTAANGVDTAYLQKDSVFFSGPNKQYNLYLMEAEKADEYCRNYYRTRSHPLSNVNTLAEFKTIVSARQEEDCKLLRDGAFASGFVEQQQLFADLRYKALFLKKLISLYKSPELTDEWKDEFRNMDLHLTNEAVRQSNWFCEIVKDYVCINSFVIEHTNPAEVADTFNTFLFDNYCCLLTGKNLEYVTASLLYNDIFQKEFSKDIPSLYERFLTLFPDSPYIKYLEPEIEKVATFYKEKQENGKIQIINYETEPECFADMMRPFLGKVVYLDIWATSCSSCIQAFSEVGKMKQHISDRDDIVFLYISVDRDSRHEKWEQMINYYNLEGCHYRGNERTSKIIYATFGNTEGVLTIPRYAIVDKNGKITFANAASPANPDELVEQLNTLLK